MKSNKPFETDQFPYREWEPDTRAIQREWDKFHSYFQKERTKPEPIFNFRVNLVDHLKPFVNKRGVRKDPFEGDEHEVRLTQVDEIPGDAKLVYKNTRLEVGEMIGVYLNSRETLKKDIEKVSKKLYKKAKKLNR